MLTALTPLGKVAQGRRRWLVSVSLYTVGGLLSSTAVGVTLGLLGSLAGLHLSSVAAIVVLTAIGVPAASRELLRLPLPLPQMHRATRDSWARRWGHQRAALAWGLDIGSLFSTWLTFAGAWWVIALAVASGSPVVGGGIFVTYWSARAATVWIGPWLIPSATITPALIAAWRPLFRPFQTIHSLTVLLGVVLVASLGYTAWSEEASPTAPGAEVATDPLRMIGIIDQEYEDGRFDVFLSRLDPGTLRPRGPRAAVPEFHDTWALSPDGASVAVGTGGQGRGIAIYDLGRVKRLRAVRTGIAAEGLAWLTPSRLVAVLQSNRLAVVNPGTGKVLRVRGLARDERVCTTTPTAKSSVIAARGLLVMLRGRQRVASRVLHMDAEGRVRSVALPRGTKWGCGRSGLAVDAEGRRAFVVSGSSVAEIDLSAMTARYHDLAGTPLRDAQPREVSWLEDRYLVASGRDARGRPAGASVIDTTTWTNRVIDPGAGIARAVAGFVLTYDGDRVAIPSGRGLAGYDADGRQLFRVLRGTQVNALEHAGARAYAVSERIVRTVELPTGRVASRYNAPAARVSVTLIKDGR